MCTGNGNCLDTSQITLPTGPQGPAGADGVNGVDGVNGTNGIDGIDGEFGGFSGEWKFDATTGGDPIATYLKFDNTILSNVTQILVNDINKDSINHNEFLESFQNTVDSVNYWGLIRIWKRFDSTIFWMGKITDSSDSGTSHNFAVEHIQSNGTFTLDDDVIISFSANGVSANEDKEVLYYDHRGSSTTSTLLTILDTYTLPANTLLADGDVLNIKVAFSRSGVIPSNLQARIQIGGVDVTPSAAAWLLPIDNDELLVDITLTRLNSSTVNLDLKSFFIDNDILVNSFGGNSDFLMNLTGDTDIVCAGLSSDGLGNTLTLENVVITKFNI